MYNAAQQYLVIAHIVIVATILESIVDCLAVTCTNSVLRVFNDLTALSTTFCCCFVTVL